MKFAFKKNHFTVRLWEGFSVITLTVHKCQLTKTIRKKTSPLQKSSVTRRWNAESWESVARSHACAENIKNNPTDFCDKKQIKYHPWLYKGRGCKEIKASGPSHFRNRGISILHIFTVSHRTRISFSFRNSLV